MRSPAPQNEAMVETTTFVGVFTLGNRIILLWLDEILHHFETMGNHLLLVFTRESSF